jgi:hypothetical protein
MVWLNAFEKKKWLTQVRVFQTKLGVGIVKDKKVAGTAVNPSWNEILNRKSKSD